MANKYFTMKALILAAGLGTRLKPWTLNHPKALALVNDKPLLQRTIEYLQRAGIYEVIVNVHHFADQVIDALERNKGWGSKYQISDESGLLMDTGGAIMKAAHYGYLDGLEHFVVVNADILTDMPLKAFMQQSEESGQLATLAVSERQSSRRLLFDTRSGLLGGWENIATGEVKMTRTLEHPLSMPFSGIHYLKHTLIEILAGMDLFNGKEPFSIIDAYLTLSRTQRIGYFDHSGSKFMDTGTPERLDAAAALFD